MPPPTAWIRRSPKMKAVSVCLVCALVLHIFSLASNYWAIDFYGNRISIFDYLLDPRMKAPDPVIESVCPILSIVSMVVLFITVTINILFLHSAYHVVLPAVMTFSFIAAMALLLSLTTWAVPMRSIGYFLSYSFGLGVIVALLDLISFFLCVVEFVIKRRDLLPRYHAQEDEETSEASEAASDGETGEHHELQRLYDASADGVNRDAQREDSTESGDVNCDNNNVQLSVCSIHSEGR